MQLPAGTLVDVLMMTLPSNPSCLLPSCPLLQPLLTVERQVVGWFEVAPEQREAFRPSSCPVFLLQDQSGYFYGKRLLMVSCSTAGGLLSSCKARAAHLTARACCWFLVYAAGGLLPPPARGCRSRHRMRLARQRGFHLRVPATAGFSALVPQVSQRMSTASRLASTTTCEWGATCVPVLRPAPCAPLHLLCRVRDVSNSGVSAAAFALRPRNAGAAWHCQHCQIAGLYAPDADALRTHAPTTAGGRR